MPQLIIIDYDETYTTDKLLWDMFITEALRKLHTVVCRTMRMKGQDSYNRDVITDMSKHNVPVVYAAECKDKWEAIIEAGYIPENAIWIDDRPMYIFMNRPVSDLPD